MNTARISSLGHVVLSPSCLSPLLQSTANQTRTDKRKDSPLGSAVDKRILPNLPEAGLENKNCFIYIYIYIYTHTYIYSFFK